MVQRFTGGLRLGNPVRFSGGANATWPFATLTVDDEGVSLALRGSIRRLLADKWMDDGEPITIALLGRVRQALESHGVRFT